MSIVQTSDDVVLALQKGFKRFPAVKTIAGPTGGAVTPRQQIRFMGTSATVLDNAAGAETRVTIQAYNTIVNSAGSSTTQRDQVQFLGAGVTDDGVKTVVNVASNSVPDDVVAQGLCGRTIDGAYAGSVNSAFTTQQAVFLTFIAHATTISKFNLVIANVGVLSGSQVALFGAVNGSATTARIAVNATTAVDTAFNTGGTGSIALAASGLTLGAQYYAVFLFVGSTMPTFKSSAGAPLAANNNVTGTTGLRFFNYTVNQTSLPTSITFSAGQTAQIGNIPYVAAII